MHALSQWLLAASAVLALSTPARSLDRKSNIEWRTFTVQDFGTTVQYPAVGSTGRRNTGVKSLYWGFKLQGLTWSFV